MDLSFNRPFLTGDEERRLREVLESRRLAGNGPFTQRCAEWLQAHTGCRRAVLTHSGTSALDLAALVAGVGPGDEIIMPSFTFVATANAFALRGARPVFVDVRADTLNLDETRVEAAITPRTRAIVPVHYAGVACEMDALADIARRRGLLLIEDAAQGILAAYKGRALGAIGQLGCLSFHETKNITAGEGGALLVNDDSLLARVEVAAERGTDRGRFLRGESDGYGWVDLGSSFHPGELVAAMLFAQLEHAKEIQARRLAAWSRYRERLACLEAANRLSLPRVPAECTPNGHLCCVLLPDERTRASVAERLRAGGIGCAYHYEPLHRSAGGRRYGRVHGPMTQTDRVAATVLRLPLWAGMEDRVDAVCDALAVALADVSG